MDGVGPRDVMHVCAAVVRDGGMVLVCSRPKGYHMEGRWEFPGGKKHPDESDAECLKREIREELGAGIHVADCVFRFQDLACERPMRILFYRAFLDSAASVLHPKDGQQIKWVPVASLAELELLPADRPIADFFMLS